MMTSQIASNRMQPQERAARVVRPPSFSLLQIPQYVQRLWEYFDLLLTLTHHRIRVRYKQSALGLGWALAQPLALMAIYTVIFSVVTRMPSEGTPYAVFVYAALLPWTFFANAVTNAAGGLVTHTHLITKVYFPREILPLSYVLAAGFDLLAATVVLAGMMIYYGIVPGVLVFWAIPILLIAAAFATSLALLLSALQVWFRDVGLAIPLLMQVWMFATPVVYPLSAVPERMRWWYSLNPLAGVVENFRRVVLQNQGPDAYSLGNAAIVSFLVLPIAYMVFKQSEATMADVI